MGARLRAEGPVDLCAVSDEGSLRRELFLAVPLFEKAVDVAFFAN